MQNIYIFSYAQECWTFISLKNTKIRLRKNQKTPTIQNSLKVMCWEGQKGWGRRGNLILLHFEPSWSTANDQSTASHWNKKSEKINNTHKGGGGGRGRRKKKRCTLQANGIVNMSGSMNVEWKETANRREAEERGWRCDWSAWKRMRKTRKIAGCG